MDKKYLEDEFRKPTSEEQYSWDKIIVRNRPDGTLTIVSGTPFGVLDVRKYGQYVKKTGRRHDKDRVCEFKKLNIDNEED